MRVFSTQQVRSMDQESIQNGIDGLILMENAAFGVTTEIIKRYGHLQGDILICAGKGNNGGDGFAIARQLLARGRKACVILLGTPAECKSADLLKNIEMARAAGVPITVWDEMTDEVFGERTRQVALVVDSIFGTGLDKNIKGRLATWIGILNEKAADIVSVDIPSGIQSDTGKVMGTAIRAKCTVTFQVTKPGLLLAPGYIHCGEVVVCPIGIPDRIIDHMPCDIHVLTASDIPALLPAREKRSNKGDYGKVFCLCGSDTMPGALALSAMAAYKTGCGLVYGCSTEKAVSLLQVHLPEAIGNILHDQNGVLCSQSAEALETSPDFSSGQNVCLLGPGLSLNESTTGFVKKVIKTYRGTMVIDADALNALSSQAPDLSPLQNLCCPPVLTPHPKEMSRLTGLPVDEILANPVETARTFARKHGVIVVLKDNRTVIASPDGQLFINTTGNPAMAKGGSGDVLAGIIAALIAQKIPPFTAAALGVYLHGLAGDLACRELSEQGVLARDIIAFLPRAMKQ